VRCLAGLTLPVGVLRLCLPVEFGRRVIAPHLGPFLARYPALELDIDLSDTGWLLSA